MAAYLTADELTQDYYVKAAAMEPAEVTKYLRRANAYVSGVIAGELKPEQVDEGLKTAVAMAFEILSQGQDGVVDDDGNITAVAPPGNYVQYGERRRVDPLDEVRVMLEPYKTKAAMNGTTVVDADKRARFF